jgi:hypothetical protein
MVLVAAVPRADARHFRAARGSAFAAPPHRAIDAARYTIATKKLRDYIFHVDRNLFIPPCLHRT